MQDLSHIPTPPEADARKRQAKRQATGAPSLADLAAADRATLLDHWRATFAAPPPKGMSQVFLRRFLAFELQSCQHGGLPKSLIDRIAREAAGTTRKTAPALRPGGRLLREWNGVTHVVDILENGCLWQGETYPSLSAVARAITGAHWSGPRFFGLADQAGRRQSRSGSKGKGAAK
ncbi:DUF2924 domain-containing protein [Antarcticimicrobium sediminis]|uniref:DUF2924 domain-containing protein n=1 Tax=Antarcticimicrobium sediminis TaxID=2546227 RepID=A0A4R5ELV5_9RHOB|nr:DUF2924 domain-containing protein [Antarcticimicrobium sediminis]TDE35635.1 DUF2924 domain-containing protein [Antarcticimicrobium sediminis]